jgi:hypothetical protein
MPAGDTTAGCEISTADVSYVKTESRDCSPLAQLCARVVVVSAQTALPLIARHRGALHRLANAPVVVGGSRRGSVGRPGYRLHEPTPSGSGARRRDQSRRRGQTSGPSCQGGGQGSQMIGLISGK